jgi:hypothetical protein
VEKAAKSKETQATGKIVGIGKNLTVVVVWGGGGNSDSHRIHKTLQCSI